LPVGPGCARQDRGIYRDLLVGEMPASMVGLVEPGM
jgi:hypothetical protein